MQKLQWKTELARKKTKTHLRIKSKIKINRINGNGQENSARKKQQQKKCQPLLATWEYIQAYCAYGFNCTHIYRLQITTWTCTTHSNMSAAFNTLRNSSFTLITLKWPMWLFALPGKYICAFHHGFNAKSKEKIAGKNRAKCSFLRIEEKEENEEITCVAKWKNQQQQQQKRSSKSTKCSKRTDAFGLLTFLTHL